MSLILKTRVHTFDMLLLQGARALTYYEIERQIAGNMILDKYLEDPLLQYIRSWKAKFKETLHYSKPYGRRELKDLQIDFESLERNHNFRRLFNRS